MLSLILALALAAPAPAVTTAPDAARDPKVLRCTAENTAAGKNRKCHVKIPARALVRACAAADKAAGRCTLDARYAAWAVPTGGAECRINKKKADWRTMVGVKVAKRTKPGAGRCELHVALR